VIAADQLLKWWAWRHVADTRINSGGDALVSATVSEWFADPVDGAVLDLLSALLLSLAVIALLRARRNSWVTISGTLMLAGWSSNLLDRLGLHFWTAPHSVRGAIDYLHLGAHYYNVADLFIIASTPVFVLSLTADGLVSAVRHRPRPSIARLARLARRAGGATRTLRARSLSLRAQVVAASAALGAVAGTAIGAMNSGTVTAAATLASSTGHR
jgi:lipoprotein signal peptidase